MKKNNIKGTIILETSIVLPVFMFLILFIYGFFRITLAQNIITHALLQSAKSLSMDSYLTEHVESVDETESKTVWTSLGSAILDMARKPSAFNTKSDWYAVDDTGTPLADKADEVRSHAKTRFVAFLVGSDDNTAASDKLTALGVVGGLNGIKFNETKMVDKNKLTVEISYELQFWFDAFGAGKIPQKQSVTVRLWK